MTAPNNLATERVSPLVRRLTAPNPGPFTYKGTCSYVLGAGDVAIVDPGPDDPRHIDALLDAIGGERLRYVLVTHTHRDHSPGARALKQATGATIAGCAAYTPPPDILVTGPGLDASHDTGYAPDAALTEGERLRTRRRDGSRAGDARPHRQSPLLRALRGKGPVYRRPHHGLVDDRHRAA